MQRSRDDAAGRRLRRRIRRRVKTGTFLAGCGAVAAVFLAAAIAAAALTTSSSPSMGAEASSPPLPAGFEECAQCHGAESSALGLSAHAGLDCLRCHGAHGAGEARPARDACPDACYDCHPDFRDRSRFHVADGSVTDPLAGRPLTCTSSCHDAHGTSHMAMLRRPYREGEYGTDGLCLSCHPRVGIDF